VKPLEIVVTRVENAEARVRSALLLLATLFALILLFQFSQLDRSWGVVRHALAQRGELWFNCWEDPELEGCSRLHDKLGDDPITEEALRAYVFQRVFLKEDAKDARSKQQDVYFDNVLRFNIPPLGISVDAQDIVPVSAFGFSALLMWLSICLDNQARALAAFLRLVPADDPKGWAIASDLVIDSLFGVLPSGNRLSRAKGWIFQVLIVFPVALVIWTFVYALETGLFFKDIVPHQVQLTLWWGGIGTVGTVTVTGYVLLQIARLRSVAASRIVEPPLDSPIMRS
jgi:hypothetical protein